MPRSIRMCGLVVIAATLVACPGEESYVIIGSGRGHEMTFMLDPETTPTTPVACSPAFEIEAGRFSREIEITGVDTNLIEARIVAASSGVEVRGDGTARLQAGAKCRIEVDAIAHFETTTFDVIESGLIGGFRTAIDVTNTFTADDGSTDPGDPGGGEPPSGPPEVVATHLDSIPSNHGALFDAVPLYAGGAYHVAVVDFEGETIYDLAGNEEAHFDQSQWGVRDHIAAIQPDTGSEVGLVVWSKPGTDPELYVVDREAPIAWTTKSSEAFSPIAPFSDGYEEGSPERTAVWASDPDANVVRIELPDPAQPAVVTTIPPPVDEQIAGRIASVFGNGEREFVVYWGGSATPNMYEIEDGVAKLVGGVEHQGGALSGDYLGVPGLLGLSVLRIFGPDADGYPTKAVADVPLDSRTVYALSPGGPGEFVIGLGEESLVRYARVDESGLVTRDLTIPGPPANVRELTRIDDRWVVAVMPFSCFLIDLEELRAE